MSASTCRLCGLDVPPGRIPTTGDPANIFCCGGCENVWRILAESGSTDDPTTTPLYLQAKALGILGGGRSIPDEPTAILTPQLESETSGLHDVRQCVLRIDGMWCSSCSWLIQHVLMRQRGVASADVDFLADTAKIVYQPARIGEDDLMRAVSSLGYQATSTSGSNAADPRVRARRRELIRASLGFISAMNVMMGQVLYYAGFHSPMLLWLLAALTVPVIVCAWPIFARGFGALRHGHATMETLVALGATIATGYSIYSLISGHTYPMSIGAPDKVDGALHFVRGPVYFDTAAMLLGLVMVGKYLESGVRASASDALSSLHALLPRKANLVRDGNERPVSVSQLAVGDQVMVRPGERIPADGIVVSGTASADESLLSGESVPVPKAAGDLVIGGSILVDGALQVRIERRTEEGMLGRMIAAVDEALAKKTPVEVRADRISRVFVPVIIALAAMTAVGTWFTHAGASEIVERSVAVLVIACPCALAIATPMAMRAAVGAAAKQGVLIADGGAIEPLANVAAIVLDKTGTVTEGQFKVRDIRLLDGDIADLVALESLSEHPIARAICADPRLGSAAAKTAESLKVVAGRGVVGSLSGREIFVGSDEFITNSGAVIASDIREEGNDHEADGLTVVYWASRGNGGVRLGGRIVLGDAVRPGSAAAVAALAGRGIPTSLISGDAERTVRSVAENICAAQWKARVSPLDKAAEVAAQRASLGTTAAVAMVGDGVNDAPAVAAADIGIAMASGAQIAAKASQVTLLTPDLRLIAPLIDLSRQTVAVMRQNLFWALAYNMVCVPAAMAGVVRPIWAVIAMLISSFTVILNTRRIRWRSSAP